MPRITPTSTPIHASPSSSAGSRRPIATAAALAVLLGLLATVPTAAAADPLPPAQLDVATYLGSNVEGAGPDQCTTVSSGTARPPVGLGYGTTKQTESRSATITSNTDATDVTHMTATGSNTTVATRAGGSLKRLDVTMTTKATLDADRGPSTACQPYGVAAPGSLFPFTVKRDGWLDLTSRSTSASQTTGLLVADASYEYRIALQRQRSGTLTQRAYLPRGTYFASLAAQATVALARSGLPDATFAAGSSSASLVFAPLGAAKAPTSGSGRAAVTLGGGVTCAQHSLALTWRRPARKVDKVTVLVNGRTARTVRHPKPGRRLTLTGIPSSKPTTVLVKLGGSTARRTYEPCS